MPSQAPVHQTPTGIGLGLRASLLSAVEQGEADGKVAFLEISPENHMHRAGRYAERFTEVARKFPIITHGLAMSLGGVDPFDASYMTELRGFTDRFGGAWHSDHLCFCGVGGQALHNLLPIPFNEATARRVAARIVEAQDRLGKPMLVENISYYLELGASEVAVILNFLNSGRHVDEDIPEIVAGCRTRHPDVPIHVSPPVGQHPRIVELFQDLIESS